MNKNGKKTAQNVSHRIHVWYIYLHLVDFYGKCKISISPMDPMGVRSFADFFS